MRDTTFRLEGGLDLTTPRASRSRRPGRAVSLTNYVVTEAGYERVRGYARWDGAVMARLRYPLGLRLDTLDASSVDKGAWAVEGSVSTWFPDNPPRINALHLYAFHENGNATEALRRLSGGDVDRMVLVFPNGWIHLTPTEEPRESSGVFVVPVRVVSHSVDGAWPTRGGSLEVNLDPGESALAAGLVPTTGLAGEVPGVGPVLGVVGVEDVVYVFRARLDAQSERVLGVWRVKEAGRGWRQVDHAIAATPPIECDFPNHRIRFVVHAFGAGFDSRRVYATAAWMPPIEINPANDAIQVLEPPVPDGTHAHYIAAHGDRLWLGYERGSVLYSSLGRPTAFWSDAGFDGGEIGVGDRITGLVGGYRGRLFVLSRNEVNVLSGRTEESFELETLTQDSGAYADTVQVLDEVVAYDDRGLRSVSATETTGGFAIDTMTRAIQPVLESLRSGGVRPVGSVRLNGQSQYRMYWSNGSALVLSHVMRDSREGVFRSGEFSTLVYPYPLDIVENVEDSLGDDRTFLTLCHAPLYGVVMLDGVGETFDLSPVAAAMELAYTDLGATRAVKRWRKAVVYGQAAYPVRLHLSARFDDGLRSYSPVTRDLLSSTDARWNVAKWDEFLWSIGEISNAEHRIQGRGRNLALTVVASSEHAGHHHTLESITLMYLPGRQER